MKPTKKSQIEIQMEEILKEAEGIVDDNYLTTNDAKRILERGYKLLHKCEELRLSRDNWRNRYELFINGKGGNKK